MITISSLQYVTKNSIFEILSFFVKTLIIIYDQKLWETVAEIQSSADFMKRNNIKE
jgi:hypothetical protein